jgi:hypothetical protein
MLRSYDGDSITDLLEMSLRDRVDLRTIVRLEGLGKLKKKSSLS